MAGRHVIFCKIDRLRPAADLALEVGLLAVPLQELDLALVPRRELGLARARRDSDRRVREHDRQGRGHRLRGHRGTDRATVRRGRARRGIVRPDIVRLRIDHPGTGRPDQGIYPTMVLVIGDGIRIRAGAGTITIAIGGPGLRQVL